MLFGWVFPLVLLFRCCFSVHCGKVNLYGRTGNYLEIHCTFYHILRQTGEWVSARVTVTLVSFLQIKFLFFEKFPKKCTFQLYIFVFFSRGKCILLFDILILLLLLLTVNIQQILKQQLFGLLYQIVHNLNLYAVCIVTYLVPVGQLIRIGFLNDNSRQILNLANKYLDCV